MKKFDFFSRVAIASAMILAATPNLSAQSTPDTTNYTFVLPSLRLTPDARFSGMCNVGIAMPSDANSIHFNPSNLALSEQKFNIGLSYSPNFESADQFFNYFSLFGKLGEKTALGGSLRFTSLGQVDSAVQNQANNSFESQLNRELALNIVLARRFGKNFSLGAGVKYIHSNLGSLRDTSGRVFLHPANVLAIDLSATFKKRFKLMVEDDASFQAGLSLSNIGMKVNYVPTNSNGQLMPANAGLGLAFSYAITKDHSITLASDFNKMMVPSIVSPNDPSYDANSNGVPDYLEQSVPEALLSSFTDSPEGIPGELKELIYSVGIEYMFKKRYSFRIGHQGKDILANLDNRLAAGLGARFSFFLINLSFAREINPTQNNGNLGTGNLSILIDLSDLGRKSDNPSSTPPAVNPK
jgi:hypothetical protein